MKSWNSAGWPAPESWPSIPATIRLTLISRPSTLSQERAYDQQQAYIAKQEEYIRRFADQRAMQAQGRKTRLERLKKESLIGEVLGIPETWC